MHWHRTKAREFIRHSHSRGDVPHEHRNRPEPLLGFGTRRNNVRRKRGLPNQR